MVSVCTIIIGKSLPSLFLSPPSSPRSHTYLSRHFNPSSISTFDRCPIHIIQSTSSNCILLATGSSRNFDSTGIRRRHAAKSNNITFIHSVDTCFQEQIMSTTSECHFDGWFSQLPQTFDRIAPLFAINSLNDRAGPTAYVYRSFT